MPGVARSTQEPLPYSLGFLTTAATVAHIPVAHVPRPAMGALLVEHAQAQAAQAQWPDMVDPVSAHLLREEGCCDTGL